MDLLAAMVLDDGRRWGEAALDWQRADAAAVLDLDGPRRHWWTRPRGSSKTTDLAGVGLAALVDQLPARATGHAYAADRDQAKLLLESADGFVARTPELGSAVTIGADTITANRSGATLRIESSDDASAWGKRPAFTIVEEFSIWPTTRGPTRLWAAIASALPKVAGSRLVVLAMAGSPGHPSFKVLKRARTSAAWRVSEVPGPTPWWSADDLEEVRADLTDVDYRRLILGEWCDGDDALSTADDLAACVVLGDWPRDPLAGRWYVIGVDLGLKNDRSVVAVCSLDEADGATTVALDRMMVWEGTRADPVDLGDVEAAIYQAWASYGRAPVVLDPWQGAGMAQRLRLRGVDVVEHAMTPTSNSRRAVRLHRLISDHRLLLPDDEALVDELANVKLLQTSPGVWRVDHETGAHDDRVTAIGLAIHGLFDQDLYVGPEEVWLDPRSGEFVTEQPAPLVISPY